MKICLKNNASVTEYTKFQYKDKSYFLKIFSVFSKGAWISEDNSFLDQASALKRKKVFIDSLKNEWIVDIVSDLQYDGWEFSSDTPEKLQIWTENIIENEGIHGLDSFSWNYIDTEYIVEGGLIFSEK